MRMYDCTCIIHLSCSEYFIVSKNVFDKLYKLLSKAEMIKMKFNNKKKPHILDEEQPHTWRDFKQRQKYFKVPEVRKLTT